MRPYDIDDLIDAARTWKSLAMGRYVQIFDSGCTDTKE